MATTLSWGDPTAPVLTAADQKNLLSPHLAPSTPSHAPDLYVDLTSSICSDGDSISDKDKLQVPKQKRQRPKSTPWTSQPQPLHQPVQTQWWWELIVDTITILLPMPFFILLATVLAVNGRVVDARDLGIIEQSVKGVRTSPETAL